LVQRLAFQVFHGEERHVPLLADLVNDDDVIALEGGGGPALTQEAAPGGGVFGQGRLHHLQGHRPLEGDILGLKDQAHAAGPEHLQDAVQAEPADLIRLLRRRQESQRFRRNLPARSLEG
jgi:hypothetical protein